MNLAALEALLRLPSPVEQVHWPEFDAAGITVFLKRDDLIHPRLPGNKWRKLKYNLLEMNRLGHDSLVTTGGAFSNHLAAVTWTCARLGVKATGIVRGLDADLDNPVLRFVQAQGMQVVRVTRQAYSQRHTPEFELRWREAFPLAWWLPEGGANALGVQGCSEILAETGGDFDLIACPVGSATTLAGLARSLAPATRLLGFPAVKGGQYLLEVAKNLAGPLAAPIFNAPDRVSLIHGYDFGGFGKMPPALTTWMAGFTEVTGIPLDPVYTGKMMYGISERCKAGDFPAGTRLLALHTGGFRSENE